MRESRVGEDGGGEQGLRRVGVSPSKVGNMFSTFANLKLGVT